LALKFQGQGISQTKYQGQGLGFKAKDLAFKAKELSFMIKTKANDFIDYQGLKCAGTRRYCVLALLRKA